MVLIFTVSGCASLSFSEMVYTIATLDNDEAPSYDSYMAQRQSAIKEIDQEIEDKKDEKRIEKLVKQANKQTKEIN